MSKTVLNKSLLLVLYGFPGSGKSYFAKELCNSLQVVHIQADRIRYELFETPKYDKAENQVVEHLAEYMMEEFLSAGVSVVYDADVTRVAQRRRLRELARKTHAQYVLAWFQIDIESAFTRLAKRDRRKAENKGAQEYDRTTFDSQINTMQHPNKDEDFVVLSGKHSFGMQKSTLMRKLFELNMVSAENITSGVVKPGMINLVSAAGRVDHSRRNIRIR
jgi:predicted kinase